jgi:hypothetical protein
MNTTIVVRTKTRDELKQMGLKGQTYDQVINELIRLKRNNQSSLDSRFGSLQPSKSSSP